MKKLDRIQKALRHEEPDRLPITEFYWGKFLEQWREDLGLADDENPYKYYDLDMVISIPNIDPHIKAFEYIKNTSEEVVVRTGFEAEMRKNLAIPMPAFVKFHTDTVEKMLAFEFDDPRDRRRFFEAGDNQIAGVGDDFAPNTPAWTETVGSLYPDFPVFGSICEAHEEGWRIIGSENMMLWMGLYPDELGKFLKRVTEFTIGVLEGEIAAGGDMLAGMIIFGDVAYVNGMMMSPDHWRRFFKPCVAEQIRICHDHDLPVVYHGCGDAREIFDDLVDICLDCYNPLEAKAGLDVLELKKNYAGKLAFLGNMDVQKWAALDDEELREYVLQKLNAGKGGGYIFASDHSVPASVSGTRYDQVIKLVRQYGDYPLSLGEFDLPI
ncbi:MAG: hypothetical protein HN368_15130 [Spirochaetales bacterium]|nr:hypothetical protein [Spirochaetales bacterium]